MTDRQWAIFWNSLCFGGILMAIIIMLLLSIVMQGQAIELCISGNATGTGLHILEVSGPCVVGNGTSWLVIGGM